MSAAIEISGLCYRYASEPVLSDITARIEESEFVALVGPNGAGKSTLIKCLNKVITGWEGEVFLFGSSVRSVGRKKMATLAGYVPQSDGRHIPFTVEEFVMMGRYPYLSPLSLVSSEDRAAVRAVMDQTGIGHLADREMDRLSGGERQTALISAALVQGAKLLLLDEPTASLDYRHQVEFVALLKRLNREQGVTVVAITHDINEAIALSSRTIALKSGRICFDGPTDRLASGRVLDELFGARFITYRSSEASTLMLAPYRA